MIISTEPCIGAIKKIQIEITDYDAMNQWCPGNRILAVTHEVSRNISWLGSGMPPLRVKPSQAHSIGRLIKYRKLLVLLLLLLLPLLWLDNVFIENPSRDKNVLKNNIHKTANFISSLVLLVDLCFLCSLLCFFIK
jgi:hypothetical protein